MLRSAFEALDRHAPSATHLVIGGGAAMVAAYDYRPSTRDVVDATSVGGGLGLADLDAAAKRVARELDLEPDWLNPYFEVYTSVLPPDYGTRLVRVYEGERLRVDALGPEDLLLVKCFAGRDRDRPHLRKLLRLAKDLAVVERRLTELGERGVMGASRAADVFDDLRDEMDE